MAIGVAVSVEGYKEVSSLLEVRQYKQGVVSGRGRNRRRHNVMSRKRLWGRICTCS